MKAVVSLAHDSSMTEHLGVKKTSNEYWPFSIGRIEDEMYPRTVDLEASAELCGNRIKTFV
jgi:hypothetical protein